MNEPYHLIYGHNKNPRYRNSVSQGDYYPTSLGYGMGKSILVKMNQLIKMTTNECVACHNAPISETEMPVCEKHLFDIFDPELVDELAREIYVHEWLMPQKELRK